MFPSQWAFFAVGLQCNRSSLLRRKFVEMEKNEDGLGFFGFFHGEDNEERENKNKIENLEGN